MTLLGLNFGRTVSGKRLKDGGLFIVDENLRRGVYLSEERISGVKHAGGYHAALEFALSRNMLSMPQAVFYSSCCEPIVDADRVAKGPLAGAEWIPVRHHDSHAALAFCCSRFDNALVLVADGGGNVLAASGVNNSDWWSASREQFTFYLAGAGSGFSVIKREFARPFDMGLGEFWRNITYFLGFSSSTHAAKVMELAAFAEPISKQSPYFWNGGLLECAVQNDPTQPVAQAVALLKYCGVSTDLLDTAEFDTRARIAAWAQFVLETVVLDSIRKMQVQTGSTRLCLGGGTMLNCRLIQKVRELGLFEDVFVSFAPSDKGQAIGNVLWGAPSNELVRRFSETCYDPFMGATHKTNITEISEALGDRDDHHLIAVRPSNRVLRELLKSGAVLATCVGPSEVGARALGNRSILAWPETPGVKQRLNCIKGRPDYNPVAPSGTFEFAERHFDIPGSGVPYMSETVNQKPSAQVPESMVHVDGTARIQTVLETENSFLRWLFIFDEAEQSRRELFALLNTSFNRNGMPIVETPRQALSEFLSMQLDGLVLNSHFVRRKNAQLEFAYDSALDDPDEYLFKPDEFSQIQFPDYWVEYRQSFSLYRNYVQWLKTGRKITTIRYMDGALSVPSSEVLPLITTASFNQTSANVGHDAVRVHGLKIKRFKDLDQRDAQRDGFRKTAHLKEALQTIYPNIQAESLVTINFISVV